MNASSEVEPKRSSSASELERGITERINFLAKGLKPNAFAKKCGVPPSSMTKYLAGSIPSASKLVEIAARNNVSVLWLSTGEGSMWPAGDLQVTVAEPSGEYVYLPLYDVRAAAGHGALVEEEPVSYELAFRKSWIHNELHANKEDLHLIYVQGDSMEPALRAGDIIMINRRSQSVQNDGIYVLRLDDTLLVKRLQRLPGGHIRVTSDNPAYQPYELAAAQFSQEPAPPGHGIEHTPDTPAIIGRVIWVGRRI